MISVASVLFLFGSGSGVTLGFTGSTTGLTGFIITSGEVVLVGLSGYVTDDTTAPSIAAGNAVNGRSGAVGLSPVQIYSKTCTPYKKLPSEYVLNPMNGRYRL